jgi:hypothetical protein
MPEMSSHRHNLLLAEISKMDSAAQDAAKELDPSWTAAQLAQWWAKWYLKVATRGLDAS